MRFLADENFPGIAVTTLRSMKHDVVWVRTTAPGSSDEAVLNMAQKEKRILITFDKDFGELAFRYGLPSACGIILFRISMRSPEEGVKRITAVLQSYSDWEGNFVVVEEARIRIKPLPR